MSSVKNSNDIKLIRHLIPLATLSEARFSALCEGLSIESGKKGAVLFQQGDSQKEFVYLLAGRVGLQAGGTEMDRVEGGSETARFALAHQIPRKVSAVAQTAVRFVRVDSDIVNAPERQGSSQQEAYHVSDIPEEVDGDWMTTMLQSKIFQRLPAANLQKVMISLEEIKLKKGELVIRQGEAGDYYYIIKSGHCSLERQPSPGAKPVKLGELKRNDSFGEDALMSGEKRSVSVKMLTDGSLLRLSKKEFLKLVKEPIIQFFDFKKAEAIVKEGGLFLDVRTPGPFSEKSIVGSHNLPFFSFRVEAAKLDESERLVVVCDDGKLSEAAAFYLIRFGFDAVVLKGGLAAVPVEALAGDEPSVATATEVVEPTSAAVEVVEGSAKVVGAEVEALHAKIGKEKAARVKSDQALAIMRCDLQAELKGKDESRLLREKAEVALDEKSKKLVLLEAAHESLMKQQPESDRALIELQAVFQKSQKSEEEKSAEIEGLLSQLAVKGKEFDEALDEQEQQLKTLQSEFDAEVAGKESIVESHQKEEAVLKSHLAELEEAVKRAESVCADESKGVEEKEAALTKRDSELEAQLSERDGELAQLKMEKEAAAQEQEEAGNSQEEALDKASQLEAELRQALKESDEAISEKEQELKALQKEFDTEASEKASISEASQQEEAALKSRLAELEEAVEKTEAARTDESKGAVEKEVALTERSSELEAQLSERDGELAQLKMEKEAAAQEQEEAGNSQEEALDKASQLEAELRQALKESDEAISEKEQELKALQKEFDTEASEKASISEASQQEETALKSRLAELEEAVENTEAARTDESKGAVEKEVALTERSSELEAQLSERDDELALLKQESERSEQLQKEQVAIQVKALEASEEKLIFERQEKEKAVSALDANEGEVSQQIESVRLELDEASQKAREATGLYEEKLEAVETARSELMQRISDGRTEQLSMQAEKEGLESENGALKTGLEAAQSALKVAEGTIELGNKERLEAAEGSAEIEQKLIDSEAGLAAITEQSESDQADLVAEKTRIAKELSELSEKCDSMREAQERLEEEVSEGALKLKAAQDEQAEQIEKSDLRQRDEREKLQEKLAVVEAERQDKEQALSHQLSGLEAREEELVEQLKEAELGVSSREEELRFNESTYAEKLIELEEGRAQFKDEIAGLHAEAGELSSQLDEKAKALAEQEEKAVSLRKENAVLMRRAEEASEGGKGVDEADMWPDDAETVSTREEIVQIAKEQEQAASEKSRLNEKIKALELDNEKLVLATKALDNELEPLKAELVVVKEQSDSSEQEMEAQFTKAMEQISFLERELRTSQALSEMSEQEPSLLEGVEAVDGDLFSSIEVDKQEAVVKPPTYEEIAHSSWRKSQMSLIIGIALLLAVAVAVGLLSDQGRVLIGLDSPEVRLPASEKMIMNKVVGRVAGPQTKVRQPKPRSEDFGSLLETVTPSGESQSSDFAPAPSNSEDEELLLGEEGDDELF